MIPRTSVHLDSAVPASHTGWTPKRDDLSDDGEGFGYFRDTWIIRGVGIREARDIIETERTLVEIVGRLARNAGEFDSIASAFEHGDAEGLPAQLRQPAVLAELEPYLGEVSPVEGLELGVAGLVYSLAAVGSWPAASCRSHATTHTWSDHPVVLLACDSHRAKVLQPMVEATECGFNSDGARPELLVVEAGSVEDLMTLAQLVVGSRTDFILRRPPRRQGNSDTQGSFDFAV